MMDRPAGTPRRANWPMVRQSGASDLHFADFRRDRPLLERARTLARELGPGVLRDEVDALEIAL